MKRLLRRLLWPSRLIVTSAEGTRLKGLRNIPAERREEAVRTMLRKAR